MWLKPLDRVLIKGRSRKEAIIMKTNSEHFDGPFCLPELKREPTGFMILEIKSGHEHGWMEPDELIKIGEVPVEYVYKLRREILAKRKLKNDKN